MHDAGPRDGSGPASGLASPVGHQQPLTAQTRGLGNGCGPPPFGPRLPSTQNIRHVASPCPRSSVCRGRGGGASVGWGPPSRSPVATPLGRSRQSPRGGGGVSRRRSSPLLPVSGTRTPLSTRPPRPRAQPSRWLLPCVSRALVYKSAGAAQCAAAPSPAPDHLYRHSLHTHTVLPRCP